MVIICPKDKSIPFICAMKIGATASYRAVPSMLMVAPTGRTKRVIRLSTCRFSSRHWNVTGNVAELMEEPNKTFKITKINRVNCSNILSIGRGHYPFQWCWMVCVFIFLFNFRLKERSCTYTYEDPDQSKCKMFVHAPQNGTPVSFKRII